jgi:hypothetical protein
MGEWLRCALEAKLQFRGASRSIGLWEPGGRRIPPPPQSTIANSQAVWSGSSRVCVVRAFPKVSAEETEERTPGQGAQRCCHHEGQQQ